MARVNRASKGNLIYHVINRANARMKIFDKNLDYTAFEKALQQAKERHPIRVLAYCVMPNHWHLVLRPYKDNDLSEFMRWLTLTHTQRWNTHHHTIGYGHLYQGRFKSFPVQKDEYFIQLCRYVERNPLRAKLVKKAQDWRWSSLWVREKGTPKQKRLLSPWPIQPDWNYLRTVNQSDSKDVLKEIRMSVNKGRPYGKASWIETMVKALGLESTVRSRGRPRKST